MSYFKTINDLVSFRNFTTDEIDTMLRKHLSYPADMEMALHIARKAGLKSATLAVARTPTPENNDEVVTITVTGLTSQKNLIEAMKHIVTVLGD